MAWSSNLSYSCFSTQRADIYWDSMCVSRVVLGSVVGAMSLSAYFCTYSGHFSPFENKVSTTCDESNRSRLSVFNHTYPVPRDLKCFSALGPESKVISKFSFRLSGCLIMVFQGSGPGHVKTYWDGPILLPIKCKIRLVCLYVHTSY